MQKLLQEKNPPISKEKMGREWEDLKQKFLAGSSQQSLLADSGHQTVIL